MAKNTQEKEYILPINLRMSEDVHSKISSRVGGDEAVSTAVTPLLDEFIADYAQGAFVLTGSDVARMSKTCGQTVDSAAKVLELVDKAAGRKAGAHSFTVAVDPNMIGQLQDVALTRNMTLEELIQESWDTIVAMGWLYAVPAHCVQFTITEGQRDQVAKLIGSTHFNGTDIVQALQKAVKAKGKE